MRRMDLHPKKKLRGRRRHEIALDRSMDRIEGWYPEPQVDFARVRLPGFQKVYGPLGTAAFRHHVVRRLVRAAVAVAGNRLPAGPWSCVAALIDWPGLWGSEVCVFFDRELAEGFSPAYRATHAPGRATWTGGWIDSAPPETDLIALAGVNLPAHFAAHGVKLTQYDNDIDEIHVREEWVVMEVLNPEGGRHGNI